MVCVCVWEGGVVPFCQVTTKRDPSSSPQNETRRGFLCVHNKNTRLALPVMTSHRRLERSITSSRSASHESVPGGGGADAAGTVPRRSAATSTCSGPWFPGSTAPKVPFGSVRASAIDWENGQFSCDGRMDVSSKVLQQVRSLCAFLLDCTEGPVLDLQCAQVRSLRRQTFFLDAFMLPFLHRFVLCPEPSAVLLLRYSSHNEMSCGINSAQRSIHCCPPGRHEAGLRATSFPHSVVGSVSAVDVFLRPLKGLSLVIISIRLSDKESNADVHSDVVFYQSNTFLDLRFTPRREQCSLGRFSKYVRWNSDVPSIRG